MTTKKLLKLMRERADELFQDMQKCERDLATLKRNHAKPSAIDQVQNELGMDASAYNELVYFLNLAMTC